jgi:hypothetical protein
LGNPDGEASSRIMTDRQPGSIKLINGSGGDVAGEDGPTVSDMNH